MLGPFLCNSHATTGIADCQYNANANIHVLRKKQRDERPAETPNLNAKLFKAPEKSSRVTWRRHYFNWEAMPNRRIEIVEQYFDTFLLLSLLPLQHHGQAHSSSVGRSVLGRAC